ncbi:MAG: O-antigen ligase family protein [Novosphingobium sp.]|nr:O-antigen ligase family protein [Novosphingobium sp.]
MTTATSSPADPILAPALAGTGRAAHRRRLSVVERRIAWAQHRREMSRMITAKVDWVPFLVFASFLLSPEARFDLGGFQIFPYRFALFAAIPAMVLKFAKNSVRFGIVDILIFATGIWMFLATAVHYPIDVALKTGAANAFDFICSYLVGRIYLRTPLEIRRFLFKIGPLVLAAGAILVVESISHQYIFRPLVGVLTGNSPDYALLKMYEIRYGLLRATGPFQHPISAGLFFASLVPLFVSADLPRRAWVGLVGCLGGIFSLSSAGIGTVFVCFLLGFYDRIQARMRIGWAPVIWGVVIFGVFIEVFSGGGLLKFIIRNVALNPQTGYFRIAIWDYGSADVMRHPWFGIGYFESYSRPKWMHTDSVDNYWLLLALRYGVPCVVTLILACLLAAVNVGRSRQRAELGSLTGRRMATGVCLSIVVIYASVLSVAVWGAELAWLTMLLGISSGLAEEKTDTDAQSR